MIQVQDVTLRQIVPQIRSEDWFVKIDLKDAYFHISILPYLPCGVKMKSCLYVLDLLTRGHLHLSKGWEGGWSRPSHLLMSRPVNLLLWLSGPTRPGVWRPLRPLYQELPSKRFVMRHVGSHRTHSSDFILWTWTLPQVPWCSHSSAALYILHRTGTRRYGGVILAFPKRQNRRNESSLERERSVTTVTSVPWRGNERCIPCHTSFMPVGNLLRL